MTPTAIQPLADSAAGRAPGDLVGSGRGEFPRWRPYPWRRALQRGGQVSALLNWLAFAGLLLALAMLGMNCLIRRKKANLTIRFFCTRGGT